MSNVLRIDPGDLTAPFAWAETARQPTGNQARKISLRGMGRNLRNRMNLPKASLGPTKLHVNFPLEVDIPPDTLTPSKTPEVTLREPYPGISGKVSARLLGLKQTSFSGEHGSTCVPVAFAAVLEKIKGDMSVFPINEREQDLTELFMENNARRGSNYLLERGAKLIKTPGIKIEGGYDKPAIFDLSQPHRITETLQAGGAAIVVDKASDHAFTFVGIAEPGTVIDGEAIDQAHYLIHNGAPQVEIKGLTTRHPEGPTLSWASADRVAQVAHERGFDMSVVLATPDNTGFVPGAPNPLGLVSINPSNPS